MNTDNLDGQSTHKGTTEHTTPNTAALDSGKVENMTIRRSQTEKRRKLSGDFTARTFAFIAADQPHFLFSTKDGYARLYISDTQAALAASDLVKYGVDIIRKASQ